MGAGYPSRQTKLGKSLHPEPAAQTLQLALIHSFRTSLINAGLEGWHTWLDHKRNQLAHRGGRLQLTAFPRRGPGPDTDRFLLLERDPDLTTVQGFLGDASTMESMYLLDRSYVGLARGFVEFPGGRPLLRRHL
jgi:hypothetical protein